MAQMQNGYEIKRVRDVSRLDGKANKLNGWSYAVERMLQFVNPPRVDKFDFPIRSLNTHHGHNSTTGAVWENKFVNFGKVDKLTITGRVTPANDFSD